MDTQKDNPSSASRLRHPSEKALTNGDPLATCKDTRVSSGAAKAASKSVKVQETTTKTSSTGKDSQTVSDEDEGPTSTRPLKKLRVVASSDEDQDMNVDEKSDDDIQIIEAPEETAQAELDRLSKEWNAPIYAFFQPEPLIETINNRRVHVFVCAAKSCKGKGTQPRQVRRYLDTSDAKSTSNLRKHAKACWGTEVVTSADETKNASLARAGLEKAQVKDGSITAVFERTGKGKVTFSHRQHTKAQARAEIVRWVTESKRPYQIVKDRGFVSLTKTGRPEYHIPSPETVSRDVKRVFTRVRDRIATMLRNYDGAISFATDAWTSPNHKAYVAVTVHFEHKGSPIALLLDFIEVPKSHSGFNLAIAFAQVLKEFGIEDKACRRTLEFVTDFL